MKLSTLKSIWPALLLVGVCTMSGAADLPEFTIDGLQRVRDTELTTVYFKPGVNLSRYQRIKLLDPHVAFRKNWQPDQNRSAVAKISTHDMEKIRTELAVLFKDVFSQTLRQGGYRLATGRADDVLTIKPAIINLDVVAPATGQAGNSHSYAESAGKMTLYMEFYDSVSDILIAKAVDRKMDRQTGYFRWQNRITNRAAAKRILKVWADVLAEGLQEVQATQQP